MKTPRYALAAIAVLFACAPLFSQSKPAKADAINSIVNSSGSDSTQYIERMAAYLFHQKINEYRSAKQLNTLVWDDTLWLAARNHTQWMNTNAKLSHEETTNSTGFTGKSPGDRYAYVSSDNGKAQWCGENALYNYSAVGLTANQIAEKIAQYSLEQWEASPGHNANMLAEAAYLEGTAFIINNEQVWATSLFARKPFTNAYEAIAFAQPVTTRFGSGSFGSNDKSPTLVVNNSNSNAPSKKLSPYQMEKNIQTAILNGMYTDVDDEKSLGEAAKEHASYMSLHKTTGDKEQKGKSRFTGKTPQKRVRKANHGLEFFKRMRTIVSELTFTKTYSADSFTPEQASTDAQEQFTKDRETRGEVKSVGMSVKVKKTKLDYSVYVVVLERRTKKDKSAEKDKKKKEGDSADIDF